MTNYQRIKRALGANAERVARETARNFDVFMFNEYIKSPTASIGKFASEQGLSIVEAQHILSRGRAYDKQGW